MLNIILVKLKKAGSFVIFYRTMKKKKTLATFEHNRIEDIANNVLNFFFSFICKHENNKCIYI